MKISKIQSPFYVSKTFFGYETSKIPKDEAFRRFYDVFRNLLKKTGDECCTMTHTPRDVEYLNAWVEYEFIEISEIIGNRTDKINTEVISIKLTEVGNDLLTFKKL